MKYAYEDMSDDQFEGLIVVLCQKLLGLSVQGFAKGPDGGRDAKFIGTAQHIPSQSAPWKGTVIVQAKHTNGYNMKFSDPDFFSTDNSACVIAKEAPRIKNLRANSGLDHYMLFSNRKLPANAESEIRSHLSGECDLPEESILLCGLESIETWLKHFPDVPGMVNLNSVDCPLLVSPDELAEVVEAFARQRDQITAVVDDPPTTRVTYQEKNRLNNMTPEFAKGLRQRFLADTAVIRTFLSAPENIEIMRLYESVVDEFQLKIIAKREGYQTFDHIYNYLCDLLFSRDQSLSRNKRLTRALLFYMYWNCDIGKDEDAATD